MGSQGSSIDASYERHYAERASRKVYPTEFVVRTFLASYPRLNFKKPVAGDRVLDVGFGDGRNTVLLADAGFDVSGIEITQGIVDQTQGRMNDLGYHVDLRVGRNSSIPYEDGTFDYILACHCCYYCDDGDALFDNLREYARVLKTGGFLVASVADRRSYIFEDAEQLPDGSMLIKKDPYKNRNEYRLQAFSDTPSIGEYFSPLFENFSFGSADNDYYGIAERVFWVVCQKKGSD
ncbi:ubiquinone/menaquinone biosynthesis C-methylase UbiE [Rhizobium sp. BK181]|uniref:class I SAM-dependent methyltransferase n=1 Tax=Rhizobium sp. BK181 TaxID=2587072 RepID=UPI001619217B|nr:class I SAM-dependent methyltransferase [Rhizobium sp. BK181]MBB3315502.1 ubiquinone/menaquinone biosynthesis C-methylase UbiE [Rhizobium sp. BK181]